MRQYHAVRLVQRNTVSPIFLLVVWVVVLQSVPPTFHIVVAMIVCKQGGRPTMSPGIDIVAVVVIPKQAFCSWSSIVQPREDLA